jgi:CubicO group peptidase (beta-lactamase class C family)
VKRRPRQHAKRRAGSAFALLLLSALASLLALAGASCGDGSSASRAADPGVRESPPYALGAFPDFPDDSLPSSTGSALQAALDAAVDRGTFKGITAAVIAANRGNWAGASGSSGGTPLTSDSRRPTHSAAKTIVAAEILRLVEQGRLGLDDRAADHLPPELEFFDANGATIRQVLGMRSGIPDLHEYDGFYPAEQASTAVQVFRKLPEADVPPGSEFHYASTNYVLLGTIIEHVTGEPLATTLRSGVLDRPGLDGIVYGVADALASDGWRVKTTPAALARWGYELYGGFVISKASLRAMTAPQGNGDTYGLGVMNFSDIYGTPAVGHEGESSVTTCCSVIRLVALPKEGVVISVQADTGGSVGEDSYNELGRVTRALREAARA